MSNSDHRCAFTLVELLVVIAIIGILMGLLIPAVQATREAARSTECRNNLRQLSFELLHHHDAQKSFPSGGWGYRWMPDSDAGGGKAQPASWVYGVLDYLEQQPLRRSQAGVAQPVRDDHIVRLVTTPLSVMNCPSRRSGLLPVTLPIGYNNLSSEATARINSAARIDYGGCMGGGEPTSESTVFDRGDPRDGPGPDTVEEADEWELVDAATGLNRWQSQHSGAANGAIIARYPIALRQVTDGASSTYLVGERLVETDHYYSGHATNDDQNAYVGFDRDNQISARYTPFRDVHSWELNRLTSSAGEGLGFHFGSAHPSTFHVSMCNGSVQGVNYDIDLSVHRAAGSRDEE
jgi:prepilin-type N-terminal cleavage/methylation domain-containing protein